MEAMPGLFDGSHSTQYWEDMANKRFMANPDDYKARSFGQSLFRIFALYGDAINRRYETKQQKQVAAKVAEQADAKRKSDEAAVGGMSKVGVPRCDLPEMRYTLRRKDVRVTAYCQAWDEHNKCQKLRVGERYQCHIIDADKFGSETLSCDHNGALGIEVSEKH